MNTELGKLNLVPPHTNQELLAPNVAQALTSIPNQEQVLVSAIDPALSDTTAFCEFYEILPEQAGNCVILEAKRAERSWLVACVVLGHTRADVNGLARRTLDARKISFAPMERAVDETGMEFGAITPIGLPGDWTILIDEAVIDTPLVIIGSGLRGSKLAVPGKLLASLPNVMVLKGLGQERV